MAARCHGILEDQPRINKSQNIFRWKGNGSTLSEWVNSRMNYCNDQNNTFPVGSKKLGVGLAEALKELNKGQAGEILVGDQFRRSGLHGTGERWQLLLNTISDAVQEERQIVLR